MTSEDTIWLITYAIIIMVILTWLNRINIDDL